ncbi:MAG: hypothetical protein PVI21_03595 [Candidatus Woesebacteria bacterium]|jgi:hypothetical protein
MEADKRHLNTWLIIVAVAVTVMVVVAIVIVLVASKIGIDNSNNSDLETEVVSEESTQTETTNKNCVGDDCLAVSGLEYPVGQLPVDVSAAVRSAIDDEYKAYSTYDAVISKLGQVRPFAMIIRAEESHIASLKAILDKYGEQIPTNPYEGNVAAKDTLSENCQIGVDAEIANVALYRDDLLSKVADYPDITAVFTNLMNASQDKHLPAFQRCR